ncbi:hypothetical protein CQA40_09070 [Helicobacter sp. MIT 01-3238]|nr:hypothetical protein CQA40_09070 [Helicobacter sp. MIT 01-3238]
MCYNFFLFLSLRILQILQALQAFCTNILTKSNGTKIKWQEKRKKTLHKGTDKNVLSHINFVKMLKTLKILAFGLFYSCFYSFL